MSDDDAFIRRIVDSPGDDLPRLVYADWLDERNDPRGAYLRAEVDYRRAAASPPRATTLAPVFNQLWVLRVSRPPIGICSDNYTRDDAIISVSPENLAYGERVLGTTLPLSYRAFLLNFNGRHPNPDCIRLRGDDPTRPTAINSFFTYVVRQFEADEDFEGEDFLAVNRYAHRELGIPRSLVAFGSIESARGEVLLISALGPNCGKVYVASRWHARYSPGEIMRVSSSLPKFLSRLRPFWLD